MLLALYDAAIENLHAALESFEAGNEVEARRECLRGLRVVAHLGYGLDTAYGDIAEQQKKLFDYVQQCLVVPSASKAHSALRVLTVLREGFEGIRPEAIQLERDGSIPPLQNLPTFETIT